MEVGCKQFGHRVVGSKTLTCNATGVWSDALPKCACMFIITSHVHVCNINLLAHITCMYIVSSCLFVYIISSNVDVYIISLMCVL